MAAGLGAWGTCRTVVAVEMGACEECGAATGEATCAELFDRLLALDHSRQQPWGSLHGEAVACYFAQHPNAPRAPYDIAPLLQRLRRFIADDQRATRPETTTIHDVAVDGSFPSAGHRERLERWARSILAAQAHAPDNP